MSLFQLPTRPSVPYNGVSGAQIERLETTQGLQFRADSFASQRIEFRWSSGSANYWYIPSRSYLRFRFKLSLNCDTSATRRALYGAEFDDAQILNSPTNMNRLYLSLVDPELFDGMASALMNAGPVRTAYLEYLDLNLEGLSDSGGMVTKKADYEAALKKVRDAVMAYMATATGVAGGNGDLKLDAAQQAALFPSGFTFNLAAGEAKKIVDAGAGPAAGIACSGAARTAAAGPLTFAGTVSVPATAGVDAKGQSVLFFKKWKDFLRYNCLPAIAPAHCGAANLFSSVTLTYGGQVVSSINSHVAQVDAFDKRTSFTANAFARHGLANVNNFYSPDFIDRCAVVTSDYIEVLWQPPLAFFRFPHAIPSGDFRLNMTVDPKWKENTFQVVGVKANGSRLVADDYTIEEMQLTMWNHFVQGPSTERAAFVLDLDNIVCQAQQSLGETMLNRQFDISPDTTSIALAHTDMTPGPYLSSRTLFRYPKRVRLAPNAAGQTPPVVITDLANDQIPIQLSNYQLLFDGKQWPQQQGDPLTSWKQASSSEARLVQQYHETHSQTGLGYNSCGPETYEDFKNAGMLLYTTWPRANSNATRLQINETFNSSEFQLSQSPTDILVFTRFKRSFLVRVENGRVMRVETAQNTTDSTLTG
jgi:hypothetical protein